MSGPIELRDAACRNEGARAVEVREGRATEVGGLDIVRLLPTKGRRTIGAWCFVDLILPPDALDPDPMEIGPHPHIGLATVTWLFDGEALHSDSLGTEQVIRPGQLNLMTSGRGIAHAELSTPHGVHGVQMWVAQPEHTRHGEPAFEHHAELPRHEVPNAEVRVFMGSLGPVASPARADTTLVGAEVGLRAGAAELAVDPSFEHAVAPLDTPVKVGDVIVEPGWLALVPPGRDVVVLEAGHGGSRLMLLGGEPFETTIQMWWNFVAREKDEITRAWHDWQARNTDRFPAVPSALPRIEAPRPPWLPPED